MLDIDPENSYHEAFVNMFRYLQANVRDTGSCISMVMASSSLIIDEGKISNINRIKRRDVNSVTITERGPSEFLA